MEQDLKQNEEAFEPERWVEVNEGVSRVDRTVELSFGTGRYTCLEEGIAKVEGVKVVFEVGFLIPFRHLRYPDSSCWW